MGPAEVWPDGIQFLQGVVKGSPLPCGQFLAFKLGFGVYNDGPGHGENDTTTAIAFRRSPGAVCAVHRWSPCDPLAGRRLAG
jgi:hypothetical protein